mgnify:FL=1|jgi:hypothetical protein
MAECLTQGVGGLKDVLKFLAERARSKDVIKNALLREMRDNLQLLSHRNNATLDVKALIAQLSARAMAEAFSANYTFKKLANNKKVPATLILNDRQKRYVDWDAERLVVSIEGKIHDLKNMLIIYPNIFKAPVNLTARLDNLYYQLLLLSLLIYSDK